MMTHQPFYQHIQKNEWHMQLITHLYAEGDTGKNRYKIVELAHYGKSLILNECIQSTERDENYYHESLICPAIALHGKVRKVLCLGGANGGIINRLVHVPGIQEVLHIDIDEMLYPISQYYLPHMHLKKLPPFDYKLIFSDPMDWLTIHCQRYTNWADLIIADLPDATKESYAPGLFTKEFYHIIKSLLAPDGIYVTHAGCSHPFNSSFYGNVMNTLQSEFSLVKSYVVYIPSYGVPWAFALGSRDDQFYIPEEQLKKNIDTFPMDIFSTYNFYAHQQMFHLPEFLNKQGESGKNKIISEKNKEYVEIASMISCQKDKT